MTDIPEAWNRSAASAEHKVLYKWFSDLNSNSSTSWCSLQSNIAAFQHFDATMSMPRLHEISSTPSSIFGRPPGPRSSKSMPRLRSQPSSLGSEQTRPPSVEKSYKQIIHTNRGDGLFLMCKQAIEAEFQGFSPVESLEALPQCYEWNTQAFVAPSSSSSDPALLSPTFEVEKGRQSAEMSDRWKGRFKGLRRSGGQLFRRR
jgi:hypothetical protein